MKERVGDEKLIIIISVAVRGINDHIKFYSQMLCSTVCRKLLYFTSGDDERFCHVFKRIHFSTFLTFLKKISPTFSYIYGYRRDSTLG